MHFLITFGTFGGTPDQIAVLNQKVESALSAYPNYKVLGNTFIVKVNSLEDWNKIVYSIGPICRQSIIPMNFIMTPLMQSGVVYNGWLPGAAWQEINKLCT